MKQLVKLFAALILLVALGLLYRSFRDASPARQVFGGLDIEKALSIEIKGPGRDVKISKKDGLWLLERPVEYAADGSAVKELLEKLQAMETGEVVTENKNRFAGYEVDEEKGLVLSVSFSGGKKPISAVFGRQASSPASVFVRLPGKDKVFLSRGLERYILEKDLKLWRDRTILKFQAAEVEEAVFFGRDGYTISGSSDSRGISGGRDNKKLPGDKSKIEALLSSLGNLNTEEFMDDPSAVDAKSSGLGKPVLSVRIKFLSGEEKTVRFGNEKDSKVYVSVSGKKPVFQIYKHKFDELRKKKEELVLSPPK